MDSSQNIPVYVCSLCSKLFTQERQHRRHQAYCRKSQSRARTRPRSCRACNQAKIKCNFRTPCHQCTRKGVACVYEHRQRQPEHVVNQKHDSAAVDNANSSSDDGLLLPSSADILENAILDDDDFITMLANPESAKSNAMVPLSPRLSSPSSKEVDCFMSLLQSNNDFDFLVDFNAGKASDFILPIQPPLSPALTTVAHFSRNQIISPVQQIFTTMLIDMIRAYPLMMTRRETFPPFVHPCCYLNDSQDRLPQVLTNCMGLAQLFVARTDDTRPFVWATIMAEVRDIVDRRHSMNIYELFSALQSSLVYMIMRAIDTLPFKAEQDLALIRAHEIICDYAIKQLSDNQFRPEASESDPHRKWREWIFDESVKRIAWVWFSLSVVFYIRTEVRCKIADVTRFVPLPCTKTEWEARTEEDWRREYTKARNAQTATSLQVFGDLVDAHRCPPAERLVKAKELEAWNAGIDNLGVLLNVAVYMS